MLSPHDFVKAVHSPGRFGSDDERQFARAVVSRVLEAHARSEIAAGRTPPDHAEEEELAYGIHAALYGVGRLQPLLDDPEVENIDINGFDQVYVGYSDGREELHAPVADSDEDLIELVQVLAANVGLSSRPFDSANPQLDLRLPDGSRMSAVMGVCSRPSISIRRSRLGKVFIDDLVGSGTMSPDLAGFLKAAVGAHEDVVEVVEGDVEAEELRGDGVDVAALLDAGLEHPEHREEHGHGEPHEQDHLDHAAPGAASAASARGVVAGLVRGDRLVDGDRHQPSLSLLR